MTYRLNLFILNAFCLFSLFLVGCNDKVVDPFIHYNLVKNSNSKINTDVDFPQSIEIDYVKDSLLRAGKYKGFSFYIEYYKLDTNTPHEDQLLKQGRWIQQGPFRKKIESRKLNNSTLKESSIYFQKDNFLMYGVFIGKTEAPFNRIINGFNATKK
ncbi:MAG: hypothetical protein KC646_09220 [Candidatus Cloacimonetes bacterium]|nr:hypothetical protein [Candidatus Cloacimonadota bacterium]